MFVGQSKPFKGCRSRKKHGRENLKIFCKASPGKIVSEHEHTQQEEILITQVTPYHQLTWLWTYLWLVLFETCFWQMSQYPALVLDPDIWPRERRRPQSRKMFGLFLQLECWGSLLSSLLCTRTLIVFVKPKKTKNKQNMKHKFISLYVDLQ